MVTIHSSSFAVQVALQVAVIHLPPGVKLNNWIFRADNLKGLSG